MAVVNMGDGFPIGMRVLAVDDDLTSLYCLATLLRRCQYLVTTATNATEAIDMLKKNRFDLLITDLHMAEMDGLALLKIARLFTDAPVLLSSVDSDKELVTKAISMGASDYLVKPLRMEELHNVWQHVFRKKMNSKKKEEDEDEVYEELEKDLKIEDPSTQKKDRVVWTNELHRCFVAAVNEMGVDKAVPRKILELMNAEKHLTRAHVASHLQKYRLRLKRISSKATQQVSPFRSSSPSGMISRLDTPAALNVPELPSSATLQSTNGQLQFQAAIVYGNQEGLQGFPMSGRLDQLLQIEGVEPVRQAVMPPIDDMSFIPLQGGNLSSVTNSVVNSLNGAVNSEVQSPMVDQLLQIEGVEPLGQAVMAPIDDMSWLDQLLQIEGVEPVRPPIDDMSFAPLQGGNLSSVTNNAVNSLNGAVNSEVQSPMLDQLLQIEGVEPLGQAVMPPIDDMSSTPLQGVTNSPRQTSNIVPFQGLADPCQDGTYASHLTDLSSIDSILNEDLDLAFDSYFDLDDFLSM